MFALAPLLTLWLGYGMISKVTMAVLIIYFPVTSALHDGLVNTPAGYLHLSSVMGASKLKTLFLIKFPAAMPSLVRNSTFSRICANWRDDR